MIPITQTKLVTTHRFGNCFPAAIASLLELPLDEVPNVEIFFGLKGQDEHYWMDVMNKFLESKNLTLRNANEYFNTFHSSIAVLFSEEERKENAKALNIWDEFYLAIGKSSRGVMHNVIMKNGLMVHDPHPSREGLIDIQYCEVIEEM